jgi:hypothetical protein
LTTGSQAEFFLVTVWDYSQGAMTNHLSAQFCTGMVRSEGRPCQLKRSIHEDNKTL